MGEVTNIKWADCSWNPWRGCTEVSPGCLNCYARKLVQERMTGRWGKGAPRARSKSTFNDPLRWNRKPWVCDCCHYEFGGSPAWCPRCEDMEQGEKRLHRRRVFLGSLMDWLDPEVPVKWLAGALDIIRRCPDLEFLCVTKRPELWAGRIQAAGNYITTCTTIDAQTAVWLADWLPTTKGSCPDEMMEKAGVPPHNVWAITSIEDQKRADERIPELLKIPAAVHGLSVEPLLERVNLRHLLGFGNADGAEISWVIVGGESGPKRRDCGVEAIIDVTEQCKAAGVPVFVKQDYAARPGQQGRILGEIWNLKQFPSLS